MADKFFICNFSAKTRRSYR